MKFHVLCLALLSHSHLGVSLRKAQITLLLRAESVNRSLASEKVFEQCKTEGNPELSSIMPGDPATEAPRHCDTVCPDTTMVSWEYYEVTNILNSHIPNLPHVLA